MDSLNLNDLVSTGDFRSERRDVLSVLWAITKACTFRCSYCVYYKSAKDAEYSSKQDLIGAARKLVRMGRPGYQITLYGGEPTLHPNFLDLLSFFASCGAPVSLRVYTNGSRSSALYERMVQAIGAMPFGIIFSLHHEFANFEKFKRALEIVAGAGCSVGVGVMFIASHRDKARKYINELLSIRQRIPFVVSIAHPYSVDGVMGTGSTEEDLAWLKQAQEEFDRAPVPDNFSSPFFTRVTCNITIEKEGIRQMLAESESIQLLSKLERPSYENFFCCGGANVMFIEEDGAVRGGVCSKSTPMGSIFRDSELALLQRAKPIRCTAASCTSIENIPLPKFRDGTEAAQVSFEFRQRAKAYFYKSEAARLGAESARIKPLA